MSITVDFIHDEEVVDAVIDQLEANLPAAWLSKTNARLGLKRIEFGSLRDWRYSGKPGDESIADLLPCILVRMTNSAENGEFDALGGKTAEMVQIAVVHLFGEKQCYDATSTGRRVQPERAKAQKAKIVSKAIWTHATDGYRRKLGNPTLTTDDTNAIIVSGVPAGINYRPEEDGGDVYAVAVNLMVNVRTH